MNRMIKNHTLQIRYLPLQNFAITREETYPTLSARSADNDKIPTKENISAAVSGGHSSQYHNTSPEKEKVRSKYKQQEENPTYSCLGEERYHEEETAGKSVTLVSSPDTISDLKNRCNICGLTGHANTQELINDGIWNNEIIHCPVAWCDEWRAQPGPVLSTPSQQLEVSRYKLAELIDYNTNEVTQVMEDFAKFGIGRFKDKGFIDLMESSLRHICMTRQATHGVKLKITRQGFKEEGVHLGDNTLV